MKGFTAVDNTAIAAIITYDLSRASILVYLILCQYAYGKKSTAWPGTAKLTQETQLHRDSVKRARRELEAAGLLVRSGRSRAGTISYSMPTLEAMKGSLGRPRRGVHAYTQGGASVHPKEEQSLREEENL